MPDHGLAGPTRRYTLIVTMLMGLATLPTAVVLGAGRVALDEGEGLPRTTPLLGAGTGATVAVIPAPRRTYAPPPPARPAPPASPPVSGLGGGERGRDDAPKAGPCRHRRHHQHRRHHHHPRPVPVPHRHQHRG